MGKFEEIYESVMSVMNEGKSDWDVDESDIYKESPLGVVVKIDSLPKAKKYTHSNWRVLSKDNLLDTYMDRGVKLYLILPKTKKDAKFVVAVAKDGEIEGYDKKDRPIDQREVRNKLKKLGLSGIL